MADRLLLEFEGVSRPVAFIGCHEVCAQLPRIFPGWRIAEATGRPEDAVLILRRRGEGYSLEAPWFEAPLHLSETVEALCGLVVAVMRSCANEDPHHLYLHGAAAEFAGKLVVFPDQFKAGKSVMSACLAANGVRLFTDDVLPVGGRADHGIAPGLAPRLRQPLPEDISAATRQFLAQRRGPSGRRYLYLDLMAQELAARGATAPIGGFVLLARDPAAEPELLAVGKAAVLRQVIAQNFARRSEAPAILRRLHRVVAGKRCFQLRYAHAEQAVGLLQRTFSNWPATSAQAPCPTAQQANVGPAVAGPMAHGNPATVNLYLRRPGVVETAIDGERFLADSQGNTIHHLNFTASAIWQLLATPISVDQVADALLATFPHIGWDRIRHDVSALIPVLHDKQLVIRAPQASAVSVDPVLGSKTLSRN